jgi:hypothetical protein
VPDFVHKPVMMAEVLDAEAAAGRTLRQSLGLTMRRPY